MLISCVSSLVISFGYYTESLTMWHMILLNIILLLCKPLFGSVIPDCWAIRGLILPVFCYGNCLTILLVKFMLQAHHKVVLYATWPCLLDNVSQCSFQTRGSYLSRLSRLLKCHLSCEIPFGSSLVCHFLMVVSFKVIAV